MSMFHELMMRKKEKIMYATIKGSLTENDGVFSGFSTSNYLEIQGLYDFSQPFEIKTKIKVGSTPSASSFITVKNSNVGSMIVMVGNGWNIGFYITDSNGNNIVSGGYTPNNTLSSNTDCFVKVVFTGTEYACYISTDDTTYTKYSIVTSSRTIGNSCNIKLGAKPPSQSFAVGTIDLNQTNIKLGSTKYNLQAVVGYTVVGSPTITDGVVSGFSRGNYIYTSNTINNKDITEFVVKIKIPSSALGQSAYQNVYSGCIALTSYSGASVFQYSAVALNGVGDLSLRKNLAVDTDYWIKYTSDGINCSSYWSTDGVNYTLGTTGLHSAITSQTLRISFGCRSGGDRFFGGSIDLKETYIKVNGKLWFNGQQA